jgi:hypothetical protein
MIKRYLLLTNALILRVPHHHDTELCHVADEGDEGDEGDGLQIQGEAGNILNN